MTSQTTRTTDRRETSLVDVAVLPAIPGRDRLAYVVPSSLAAPLVAGTRVLVPLGRRQVTGVVLGPARERPATGLREILDVLDDTPLLGPDLLALCEFAATYYMASLGDVLSTAVLADFRAESRTTAKLLRPPDDSERLGKLERRVVEALAGRGPLRVTSLVRTVRSGAAREALRSLAGRGIVSIADEPTRRPAQARLESTFVANREPTPEEREQIHRRAPLRAHVLDLVREAGPEGVSARMLDGKRLVRAARALVASGVLREERSERYRDVTGEPGVDLRLDLTSAQAEAVEAVVSAAATGRFETFLLRGVTGSGKTEVYLRSVEAVLEKGKGALLLVPEIALTPGLVDRVCSRFGRTVALLHSGLSAGERWDEWRRLARREARIAVGVRSALFAPLPDLGLVVVDEEHDGAYKQEEGLRYNARDLAIVRGRNASCPVVLGSATPSLESHWNVETGKYRSLELPERIARRPLPEVELVDLRVERPEDEQALLAPSLVRALRENLAVRRQSLLFLNRRGWANYLQCKLCGHVIGCPNCSVTLTYHLRGRELRCHHCDHRRRAPDLCPECQGPSLRDFGFGTEQVEDVVRKVLPEARVGRMDRDTMRRKGALGRLLGDWSSHRIDVLVGTQMVTKGHDVPNVTLVGVLNADQLLNFPDFRAAERTFQALTQVAGRAGRGDDPGRVLVQTLRPDHYALRLARTHDFLGFAERELRYREQLRYPPYSRVTSVRFDGLDAARVEATSRLVTDQLRRRALEGKGRARVLVLGPAPAPLERVRGRTRWHLLLKGNDPRTMRSVVRPALEATRQSARASGVRVVVDVDPYSML